MSEEIDSGAPTAVTIYGQTYRLRAAEDEAYLIELAGLVDHRMKEVAEATGTADTLRVAILAALNIADDYLQTRRGRAVPSDGTDERLARMVKLLDEALVG